jgi:phosphinothricin acetyltransferase
MGGVIIRAATPDDAPVLAAIYGHHVLHGLGTFEETPPSAQQMADRLAAVQARSLPWVVAEADGAVQAFAYAAPFRLRAAYRYTAEDSVYVAPNAVRRGLGRASLGAVVEACRVQGLRQLVALIGDSANVGSLGLHRALGFAPSGSLPAVGFKHGRWVDVMLMTLALNGGQDSPPDTAGLDLS